MVACPPRPCPPSPDRLQPSPEVSSSVSLASCRARSVDGFSCKGTGLLDIRQTHKSQVLPEVNQRSAHPRAILKCGVATYVTRCSPIRSVFATWAIPYLRSRSGTHQDSIPYLSPCPSLFLYTNLPPSNLPCLVCGHRYWLLETPSGKTNIPQTVRTLPLRVCSEAAARAFPLRHC